MSFSRLRAQLLTVVRERVRNGEMTERSLGRLTGISQPHMHNVLKGVRILSNNLADELLIQLKMNVGDLNLNDRPEFLAVRYIPLMVGLLGQEIGEFEPARTMGLICIPALTAASLWCPVMARLGRDDEARPRFQEKDLVLIDQAVRPLADLRRDAVYVVATDAGPRLRYLRHAGERLFLVSEASKHLPERWELVDSEKGSGMDAVRGRVMWMSRTFANN